MPVKVTIDVLGIKDVTRVVKNRAQLTTTQWNAIGKGLVSGLNGPQSEWPKKGGGVRGEATGTSRKKFAFTVSNGRLEIKNTATQRDRNRALGYKGGSSKRYAKYPELGTPNKASAGRAARTIRKILPRVLERVLGKGWDITPPTLGDKTPTPRPKGTPTVGSGKTAKRRGRPGGEARTLEAGRQTRAARQEHFTDLARQRRQKAKRR